MSIKTRTNTVFYVNVSNKLESIYCIIFMFALKSVIKYYNTFVVLFYFMLILDLQINI